MGTMAFQITSLTIVYSTVSSGAEQRKHQSSASLAFVRGIHRWPVNSPHKCPVTRKMFPFNDVFMISRNANFPCVREFCKFMNYCNWNSNLINSFLLFKNWYTDSDVSIANYLMLTCKASMVLYEDIHLSISLQVWCEGTVKSLI